MHPFTYLRAGDPQQASALAAQDRGTEFIAGGTDMLQLLKDDVRRPQRLVDISGLTGLVSVAATASGLRLGALARMSDVADNPAVRDGYPAIAQALLASASPQVRNMATIGGNLLQRTRCPYFRDTATSCNKREPGAGCAAIGGENRLHAVLGGSEYCVATHASDLAVALAALDAVVVTQGATAGSGRRIPLVDFHLVPGDTPQRENVLQDGELIVAVEVPAAALTRRSLYRKMRDRASFEFALASAAVALEIDGGIIRQARVALGGVGTKPWRAHEAERALVGAAPQSAAFEAAASRAVDGAKPLAQNGFKIELAQRVVIRALTTLGA
jgi:xanthine dehydrogenase YagS FAD-binding subunit